MPGPSTSRKAAPRGWSGGPLCHGGIPTHTGRCGVSIHPPTNRGGVRAQGSPMDPATFWHLSYWGEGVAISDRIRQGQERGDVPECDKSANKHPRHRTRGPVSHTCKVKRNGGSPESVMGQDLERMPGCPIRGVGDHVIQHKPIIPLTPHH
jgi:hypothetical protein